jgi:hypothetical protein
MVAGQEPGLDAFDIRKTSSYGTLSQQASMAGEMPTTATRPTREAVARANCPVPAPRSTTVLAGPMPGLASEVFCRFRTFLFAVVPGYEAGIECSGPASTTSSSIHGLLMSRSWHPRNTPNIRYGAQFTAPSRSWSQRISADIECRVPALRPA